MNLDRYIHIYSKSKTRYMHIIWNLVNLEEQE